MQGLSEQRFLCLAHPENQIWLAGCLSVPLRLGRQSATFLLPLGLLGSLHPNSSSQSSVRHPKLCCHRLILSSPLDHHRWQPDPGHISPSSLNCNATAYSTSQHPRTPSASFVRIAQYQKSTLDTTTSCTLPVLDLLPQLSAASTEQNIASHSSTLRRVDSSYLSLKTSASQNRRCSDSSST